MNRKKIKLVGRQLFDVELLLIANKENIKITEEPVEYIHDRDSKVFLFRDTFKMINEILKIKNRI